MEWLSILDESGSKKGVIISLLFRVVQTGAGTAVQLTGIIHAGGFDQVLCDGAAGWKSE